MINRIFLDLDECLIQSLYCSSDSLKEDFKRWYGCFDYIEIKISKREVYLTFIRPLAHQLIEECKKLVGEDNVYILTSSTADYAGYINAHHNLGFYNCKIFTREDIDAGLIDAFTSINSNNILIDNENYSFHSMRKRNKRNFLNLKEDNLIQIKEFDVYNRDGYDDKKEQEELGRVLTLLKTRLQ